ncbi:MAG: zf-HC2 domain-containing protein [Treponema sp.]|jgi:hypothetical protein|nr:zf-HC2 domain-containing protein [Treponema sp.]
MCPDRQILSVYLDGELPSPWKEKLENHLGSCARCREKLEAYRNMSCLLGKTGNAGPETARERVWLRLQTRAGGAFPRSGNLWRRNVSVPLPVAAAAAIFFIALGALVFRQLFFTGPAQEGAMAAGVDLRNVVPVSDMNGIWQYLGSQDTGDIVILRLPESRNFMSSGEPRILKAAELPAKYPRGFPVRMPAGSADYGGKTPR